MALVLSAILNVRSAPKEKPFPSEPEALFIFPVGGQRSSTLEVRVEGQTLQGTYAVWTDCREIQASVKQIVETTTPIGQENDLPEDRTRLSHRVTLKVRISAKAALGGRPLSISFESPLPPTAIWRWCTEPGRPRTHGWRIGKSTVSTVRWLTTASSNSLCAYRAGAG